MLRVCYGYIICPFWVSPTLNLNPVSSTHVFHILIFSTSKFQLPAKPDHLHTTAPWAGPLQTLQTRPPAQWWSTMGWVQNPMPTNPRTKPHPLYHQTSAFVIPDHIVIGLMLISPCLRECWPRFFMLGLDGSTYNCENVGAKLYVRCPSWHNSSFTKDSWGPNPSLQGCKSKQPYDLSCNKMLFLYTVHYRFRVVANRTCCEVAKEESPTFSGEYSCYHSTNQQKIVITR